MNQRRRESTRRMPPGVRDERDPVKHVLDIMRAIMEATPAASEFIPATLTNTKEFLEQFEPPNGEGTGRRTCRRIAEKLCTMDAMTRLARTPEIKEAACVVATRMLLGHGWRMKEEAADRAAELNAMDTGQLDEWERPYREQVDEFRSSVPRAWVH